MNAQTLKDEDWNWADIVLVSAMFVQRDALLTVVKEAKTRGKIVAAGGPYPTSLPEEVADNGCDFLVLGEGENTVPLFLSALADGKRGGVFEPDGNPDLSLSPMPRFDLLDFTQYVALPLQTSRGCPFDCEFCDVVNLYGRKPRYKTPEQVINELETLFGLGWRNTVFVSDDNFIGSRRHAKAILQRLVPWMKRRGEPFDFITQASVNLGQDIELIDLMTEANFWSVFIGVESPDREVLELSHKYQNVNNPVEECLINMNRNGLVTFPSFVIGFDGEEKGVGERICALVERTAVPLVMLNTLQPLAHTTLWNRLKDEGRLLERRVTGDLTARGLQYVPTRPESEILAEFLDAWDYIYEPSRYMARVYRYFLIMRPTRQALGMDEPKAASSQRAKETSVGFLVDLKRLFLLIWWQGIRSSVRGQFWKQLVGMARRNPSRLVQYLHVLGMGENFFHLREEMRRRFRTVVVK